MLTTVFNLLKVAAVILYLTTLASLIIEPLTVYRGLLFSIIAVLLLAHIAEYLMVKKKLTQSSESPNHHFLQVLLFGFLYWVPLLYPTDKNSQFTHIR